MNKILRMTVWRNQPERTLNTMKNEITYCAHGKKLKRHLEIEFEQKKNRQIYWDDVAMFCYPEEYQLGIRPMNKDDIIEVDNLSELIALDASYKKYVEEK